MKGQYTIKILPTYAIDRDYLNPKKRERKCFVQEKTFSSQSSKLIIRPKAARYGEMFRNSQVYAVAYENERNNIECLFMFVYKKHSDGSEFIEMTRCVGKLKVKEHWVIVKKYLNDNKEKIKKLPKGQEISF